MKQLRTAALLATVATLAASGQAMAANEPKRPVVDFKSCAKPLWPQADLRAEHTGTVTLNFTVDENGAVQDSHIVKSSGHATLDEAARSGIAKCHFKNGPGKVDLQYVWALE